MSHVAEQFTWLYFPENTVPFYRVTFLSRYGEMTPDNNKYWSVLCECAYAINDNNVSKFMFYLKKKSFWNLIEKQFTDKFC